MTDQLLSLLSIYGLPALFAVLVVASFGVPLPVTFLLVAAGSFVAQGELNLWQVCALACAGAVVGDQIGYCVGRFGGRGVVRRITSRFGGRAGVERAEAFARRWGGAGVFLSRWLFTPLGPWINLTSGEAQYPWLRFALWDVAGEALWVLIYVSLGRVFSGSVQELADLLGNLAWVALGLLATALLGWKVFNYFRAPEAAPPDRGADSHTDAQAIRRAA
ncbi:MAG: DedA family protein [Acidobacteriota bacterium]|nr:DedA family protein [Acidobacteriota bacterium]